LQTMGSLNQIYPKPHKNMWPRWKRMAVLWPNFGASNPDKENFVRRNRIVAGMTEATIVMNQQIVVAL
jgi:DNA processing protein